MSSTDTDAPLGVTRDQGLLTLTLQRPAAGNALSADLVEGLLAHLDAASRDGTHTVLLRGAGRHFCTGFDLSDLATASDGDLLQRFVRIETLLAALWHAPMRTAALVHGHAWGAGADLVAACEQRAVTPAATFRFPGAQFGLVLGSRRLAERVGAERARRWIETGAILDAPSAVAQQLADVALPDAVAEQAWLAKLAVAPAIDGLTAAAIRQATRADTRDADLAALVRSAARPGLKQRIQDYAARVEAARRR